MGKYESNSTALALALSYSDQALEACQALISLLDSEIGVLLANCRAAGIGGFGTCVYMPLSLSAHCWLFPLDLCQPVLRDDLCVFGVEDPNTGKIQNIAVY